MHCYGWTHEHVMFDITSAQGWCWYNWSKQNEMTAFGPVYEPSTDSYVAQERKRLMKERQ